jgi:hypothetical protein
MERYEYSRLFEYSLHNENFSERHTTFAYVLQTEHGSTVLHQTALLAALNEVGRHGWLVYEVIHPSQAGGSMSQVYLDQFQQIHGWRPRTGVLGGQRSLRRTLS